MGTCHTVPFTDRSRVARSDTDSTVPVTSVPLTSPTSMMSPTPYWSSTRMKMPARKSFTRLWAPKPSATPAMPGAGDERAEVDAELAEDRDARRCSTPRTAAIERSTWPSVCGAGGGPDRDGAGVEHAVGQRVARSACGAGVRLSRRVGSLLPESDRTKRSMIRSRSRTTTQATTRMMAIVSGLAKRVGGARPASSESVRSSTSRQMNDGSGAARLVELVGVDLSVAARRLDPTVAERDRPARRLAADGDRDRHRGAVRPAGRRRQLRAPAAVAGRAPAIPMPPDGVGYRLKRKLLGPPLHSDELEHQRLGKPTALAVFASDNLSLERLRHRGDPPRPRAGRRPGSPSRW